MNQTIEDEVGTYMGYVFGICIVASNIPILYHIFKTNNTRDIRYGWIALMTLISITSFFYGVLKNEIPFMVYNPICFVCLMIMFGYKIKHLKDKKNQQTKEAKEKPIEETEEKNGSNCQRV